MFPYPYRDMFGRHRTYVKGHMSDIYPSWVFNSGKNVVITVISKPGIREHYMEYKLLQA